MKTVLLAVMGTSPSVLTETVWALAREVPPTVPEEIVTITTSKGAEVLRRALLTPRPDWGNRTVWQVLRESILGEYGPPRLLLADPVVISQADTHLGVLKNLADIRTEKESAAAAETILEQVRRVTMDPERRLIGSLAGGRKTMGALLHAAISLAGRRGDRLTHVLVSEPFDHPGLRPHFFFPGQPGSEEFSIVSTAEPSQATCGTDARIDLADVPVLGLGELLARHTRHPPASFHALQRTARTLLGDLSGVIEIRYVATDSTVIIDGEPVKLSGLDLPFFLFLLDRARQGLERLPDHTAVAEALAPYVSDWAKAHPEAKLDFGTIDWRRSPPEIDEIRKRLHSLRDRLRSSGLDRLIPVLFPTRNPVGFPPGTIKVVET